MHKGKNGISMIIILWIITILTVLTTATVLMTTSDITSTLNLVKRKRTIKSAETSSEFVVSFLPEFKDLSTYDTLVTDTFVRGDTTFGHKLYLSPDSTDIGVFGPIPIIRESGTTGAELGVNPILTSWALILEYKTRGLIEKGNEYVAIRRIEAAASFAVPGGEEMMGHTMY